MIQGRIVETSAKLPRQQRQRKKTTTRVAKDTEEKCDSD